MYFPYNTAGDMLPGESRGQALPPPPLGSTQSSTCSTGRSHRPQRRLQRLRVESIYTLTGP